MCKEVDVKMDSMDIRQIIGDGIKRGLTPYDALLEAGIIKHPDKDFILNTYDFSSGQNQE